MYIYIYLYIYIYIDIYIYIHGHPQDTYPWIRTPLVGDVISDDLSSLDTRPPQFECFWELAAAKFEDGCAFWTDSLDTAHFPYFQCNCG